MFTLAHVTDPHFRSFAGARPAQFFSKRAVGALNLLVNRRRQHKMELLTDLAEDLRTRQPDHLALTGDLGNVSLESEWQAALTWITALERLPETVTVIPGNHDTYTPEVVVAGTFERLFAPYQTAQHRQDPSLYPFVRIRGEVALIAVNTCVPTQDLGAWGKIGEDQLQRLQALLTLPALTNKTRVVLLHHPPVVHKPGEHRNLRDRAALAAVLARTGADLVLHGHDHQDEIAHLPGPNNTRIPIIGAGSASYAGSGERRSRYNVYAIEGKTLTATTYVHRESSNRFTEAKRLSF